MNAKRNLAAIFAAVVTAIVAGVPDGKAAEGPQPGDWIIYSVNLEMEGKPQEPQILGFTVLRVDGGAVDALVTITEDVTALQTGSTSFGFAFPVRLYPNKDRADLFAAIERLITDVMARFESDGASEYSLFIEDKKTEDADATLPSGKPTADGGKPVAEIVPGKRYTAKYVHRDKTGVEGYALTLAGSILANPRLPLLGWESADMTFSDGGDDDLGIELRLLAFGNYPQPNQLVALGRELLPPQGAGGWMVNDLAIVDGEITALDFGAAPVDLGPVLALPKLTTLNFSNVPARAGLAAAADNAKLEFINGLPKADFLRLYQTGFFERRRTAENAFREANPDARVYFESDDGGRFIGARFLGKIVDPRPLAALNLERLDFSNGPPDFDNAGWDALGNMGSIKEIKLSHNTTVAATYFRERVAAGALVELADFKARFLADNPGVADLSIQIGGDLRIDALRLKIADDAEVLDWRSLAELPLRELFVDGPPPARINNWEALEELEALGNIRLGGVNFLNAKALAKARAAGVLTRWWDLNAAFMRDNGQRYALSVEIDEDGRPVAVNCMTNHGGVVEPVNAAALIDVALENIFLMQFRGVDLNVWRPLGDLPKLQAIGMSELTGSYPPEVFRKALPELARTVRRLEKDNPGSRCPVNVRFGLDGEGRLVTAVVAVYGASGAKVNVGALLELPLAGLRLEGQAKPEDYAVLAALETLRTVNWRDRDHPAAEFWRAVVEKKLPVE